LSPLKILGSRIDAVSFPEAVSRVRDLLPEPGTHQVITGNTLMLLDAQHDAELHAILEHAALVVPESSGIYWASRWLGRPLTQFVPGIDFMLALCGLAADTRKSIYLLGAKPGVAERAAEELRRRFPKLRIAGADHGYFKPMETGSVVERIRAAAPTFLFVGMSVPGQEKWIASHLRALDARIVMGVGGSFDVLSGHLRRAPSWMRRLGIEWLYRLLQEPWRWRRIARLPIFAVKVLRSPR
jgi:N-acetylglucosaminyldiphosphoundecaprenol N-acetyl-beta-D-mannosaminyltransferase